MGLPISQVRIQNTILQRCNAKWTIKRCMYWLHGVKNNGNAMFSNLDCNI